MSRIYEIFGTNAHAMTRALMESAGAACKIPSGASVALKPNLVVAASPETGATTHAGVLSGAIEYLRDHGFRDISIIEGSWVGDDTGRAFRAAGYEAVGKKYGVPLFDLKRDKTRRVDTPLRPMDICCRALAALLKKDGIEIARQMVGNYVTSLEMPGVSVTLMRADDELLELFDAPVNTVAWK